MRGFVPGVGLEPTHLSTRVWVVRVYQFRHPGNGKWLKYHYVGANVKNNSAIRKKIVKNILSEFEFISKFAPR